MSKPDKARVKAWRNGAAGFWLWVEDIKPRIPSARGGFTIFQPESFQIDEVSKALELKPDESPRYGTIVLCWPRRHSKTVMNALIVLWRFYTKQTQTIKVLANSERQVTSTAFKLAKDIILNTPALIGAIGKGNVQQYKITYPALQNTIQAIPANERVAYGAKVTVAWTTELHAAKDDSVLQILASSTGDSEDGLVLIDSTTDGTGGPIHLLEQFQESGEDPTVFVSRIEYSGLEEALEKSPPWIRRNWLKSRKAQMLPALFASQHLNQRGAAVNALFAPERIRACQDTYRAPVAAEGLKNLFQGRKYIVGGGLDRAYGFSLNGDATIWTTVAKAAGDDGEAEYTLLNQESIPFSSGRGIKKTIAQDHERYDLENAVIEAYNAQDIASWAQDARIPVEVIHPTIQTQVPLFTELHRIVAEGRLHFSAEFKNLAGEMKTFKYDTTGPNPKFGHPKGFHDDRVYSLAWAIYALRDSELAAYEVSNIVCHSKSTHARLCYLRGGSAQLYCAAECEAHRQVESMYLQHIRRRVDHELTLPEFFHSKVRRRGALIYQGV